MEYCLKAKDLTKKYGHFLALDGLNMHIEKGSIYGFVGRNGSGKTTLIRLLCGLQNPTSGTFEIYGTDNTSPAIKAARRRMGAIVEVPSIYLGMTAAENMKQQYEVLGIPDYDGISEILDFVGLSGTGKKKAKNFSLGMRQRLGIAISLAGDPDFIVLDEPVNGLDPQGMVEVRELILKLNREKNITVLISSHILSELSKLATHYGFVDRGRLVKEISAEELEKACKKYYKVQVKNTKTLSLVLESAGADYKIISETDAEIYSEVDIAGLAQELADKKDRLLKIVEKDEDLETYFINLVGGGSNA